MKTDLDLIKAMLDPTLTEDECRQRADVSASSDDIRVPASGPHFLDSDPAIAIADPADSEEDASWM